MIFKRLIFPLLVFLCIGITAQAQDWTNKNETSEKFEFNELTQEFDNYWQGREIPKGSGYKPFKRWQHRWENQLDKNGQLPAAGAAKSAFDKYLRDHNVKQEGRSSWQSLGPNSTVGGYAGTGRINAIGFHPTNTNVIYAGSAGGGLWKTTDGGNSWLPKTDFLGSIGISKVIVHPTNPETVYIATGDGDASDSYSIGVMKSTNGGDTWANTGLNWSTNNYRLIREMVMDPNNSDALIAATNNGIYRTTDAGASWTQEQTGNFYDVEFNPDGSTNTFYAATKNEIFRSIDNGDSWSLVQTISGSNRLALATTADNSNYVYVLSSQSSGSGFNGLWRSTNSGTSFTSMSTSPNILGYSSDGSGSGGQGWYDLVIAADPSNANTVYVAGVNNWKSTDGGATWSITSHWYGAGGISEVHADKHELEWQGNVLWEGNDGGIYRTSNGGDTWTDKTANMIISQMYRIGVSETDGRVMAGLQDNGSKQRQTSGTWADEVGGDGMDCAINPENSSVMYACIQNGELRRSTNGGASWSDIQDNIPGTPSGAWVTPYRLNPQRPATIIAAYTDVYRSYNQGTSWVAIGTGLGTSKKTILTISPQDSNYMYVGTSNALWQTTDGGANWTAKSTPGSSTTMVKVSPSSPTTLYATRSTYGSARVYRSNDGGSSWTSISGTLPQIPANCIEVHDDGDETLYVGLDIGVYYRKQSDSDWTLYSDALPNMPVFEIEIKEQTDEVYIASYGRGLWKNNTIGVSSVCKSPTSISLDQLEGSTATFSWTEPNAVPSEGYEYALTESATFPTSGTLTSNITVSVTDLEGDIEYYFYVRSKCSSTEYSSWISYGPLVLPRACGPSYYDTGGASANYGDNENESYTICPSNAGDVVEISFTSFNVETNWDAMYVHNGDSIDSPLFSSTNGASNAGFPAGGYWGTSLPGTFTSTHESGCLTVSFRSDGSVTRSGWEHTSTCVTSCADNVENSEDEGSGSLRSLLDCSQDGIITFDESLYGTTVSLDSKLVIDGMTTISVPDGNTIILESNSDDPVFDILASGTLELINIIVVAGTENVGAAVINQGTLKLNASQVKQNQANTPSSLIENNGTLQVINNSVVE